MAYVGRNHDDYVSTEPAPHAVEAPDEDDLPIAQLFADAFLPKRKRGRLSNLTNEARTKPCLLRFSSGESRPRIGVFPLNGWAITQC